MVALGIDAHKRNHTVVAVDEHGRKLGECTTATTSDDHLTLLTWAERFARAEVAGRLVFDAPGQERMPDAVRRTTRSPISGTAFLPRVLHTTDRRLTRLTIRAAPSPNRG